MLQLLRSKNLVTITVHIPDKIEMQIREHVSLHRIDIVRNLLWEAVRPTIEMLINYATPSNLSDNEFEDIADQLADEFTAYFNPAIAPLSDYAVSREGIYADHL